ncbi:MAG: hypothetical protein GQ574_29155 [Crocinitomix sp.]|nr:hypothetical protein [Crocinitomix sp.]
MKSKKIDTKDFIVDYCQTLEQDKDNNFFLKIPVKNYEELNFIRLALVNGISNTAALHEYESQINLPLTIRYLAHVINNISLISESEGLSVLFENLKQE